MDQPLLVVLGQEQIQLLVLLVTVVAMNAQEVDLENASVVEQDNIYNILTYLQLTQLSMLNMELVKVREQLAQALFMFNQ